MRKNALKTIAITLVLAIIATFTSLVIHSSGNYDRGFPSSYFTASYTSTGCGSDLCQLNPVDAYQYPTQISYTDIVLDILFWSAILIAPTFHLLKSKH